VPIQPCESAVLIGVSGNGLAAMESFPYLLRSFLCLPSRGLCYVRQLPCLVEERFFRSIQAEKHFELAAGVCRDPVPFLARWSFGAEVPALSRGPLRRQSSEIRTGCANECPSGSVRGLCQEDEKSSCCMKDGGRPSEVAL
jgi:hypothetical protein